MRRPALLLGLLAGPFLGCRDDFQTTCDPGTAPEACRNDFPLGVWVRCCCVG